MTDVLNKRINADALITKLKDVALGVLTADCVPIILYDEMNQIYSKQTSQQTKQRIVFSHML